MVNALKSGKSQNQNRQKISQSLNWKVLLQIIRRLPFEQKSNSHLIQILSDVAVVPSKRLRNKIAGFATHLMKRI